MYYVTLDSNGYAIPSPYKYEFDYELDAAMEYGHTLATGTKDQLMLRYGLDEEDFKEEQ